MEEKAAENLENQPLLGQGHPRHAKKRLYASWLCPVCGTKTWITNKQRHLQTKKHKDVVYVTTERFEMLR